MIFTCKLKINACIIIFLRLQDLDSYIQFYIFFFFDILFNFIFIPYTSLVKTILFNSISF